MKRWARLKLPAGLAAAIALSGQEKPLTVSTTITTGYYSTSTRSETKQTESFVPVGARFEMGGYVMSPELLSFSAQPEINLGPQASDAGFQGGNGVTLRVTALRTSFMPVTFRYSNTQVEDVYFGGLTQLSGYSLRERNKDLGLTWEFHPKGLPSATVDWGEGSVNSRSSIAGVSDYQSSSRHLNVDSKYERWGWDMQGFARRGRQDSDLLESVDGSAQTGSLRETARQYQGSARRGFLGDSELYVDAGAQSTASLLFTLPIELSTRYASANLRLTQRRRWKSLIRTAYSSNLASQLLERAATGLTGPGTTLPDGNVLAPYARGMSNLNISGTSTYTLGYGLGLTGSAERTAVFAAGDQALLNSAYLTASAGIDYAHRLHWGHVSGEYLREFGAGSLIGESGSIRGQRYTASVQRGNTGNLIVDGTIHGSDQQVRTSQPISNRSFSAEGSVSEKLAGTLSARLGGGWQWGSIVNSANQFRTNGYTARASLDHPLAQFSVSLNNSLSDSLPFYNQLLAGPLGPVALTTLRPIPSDYRGTSFTLHANPIRKVELSATWTRSSQHLDGILSNDFELLNVFATYHFRRLQFEGGLIRTNQAFSLYPDTLRKRVYLRISRTTRLL